eukprot:Gregarina_sp_Poly_1__6060@NODE_319_length_9555_cov_130_182863_g273_i0_p3_GENE_NODE_319_length_9555_cov_130_182863_g273_i0NODE_319_length_9555_cov_130_182863_g273_i0_p3_ORF_typecomplete_len511_score52_98Glyco_transf_34/PF05637_12/0_14_NODE_319_length_9555_cov_130_182863_g273_i078689400
MTWPKQRNALMLIISCLLVVLINVSGKAARSLPRFTAVSPVSQIKKNPLLILQNSGGQLDETPHIEARIRFLEVDSLEPVRHTLKLTLATNLNPVMWNITIYYPPPHLLGNSQPSPESPMVCDFLALTAARIEDVNGTDMLHSYRLEYARRQFASQDHRLRHTICLVNFDPIANSQLGKNEAKVIKYRAALHALGMIHQRRIVSPSYTSQKPPILLLDDNTFITNTQMTVFDIFRRLDIGSTYTSAAEQFCEQRPSGSCTQPIPDKPVIPKIRARLSASERYHSDFFLVVNTEADCYTPWAISSGALIFKAHTLSKLLLEAVILTAVSGVQHSYHGFDQGSLNFVLSELFDVDVNKLRNLCYPYNERLWGAMEEQFMFDVELNLRNLEEHFIFNALYEKYRAHLTNLERTSRLGDRVLVVHPRWLAPPACPGYLNHKQRGALTWHGGDYLARFNGCDSSKAMLNDLFIKRAASAPPTSLPFDYEADLQPVSFRVRPLEDPGKRPWAILDP